MSSLEHALVKMHACTYPYQVCTRRAGASWHAWIPNTRCALAAIVQQYDIALVPFWWPELISDARNRHRVANYIILMSEEGRSEAVATTLVAKMVGVLLTVSYLVPVLRRGNRFKSPSELASVTAVVFEPLVRCYPREKSETLS